MMVSTREFNEYVAQTLSEKSWQSHVESLLRLNNFLVYHTHDSRRSPAGFPDLVAVRGERMIMVELKTQRGRVRPEQQVWLDALRQVTQVETRLWRPGDRGEVLEIIQA